MVAITLCWTSAILEAALSCGSHSCGLALEHSDLCGLAPRLCPAATTAVTSSIVSSPI